MKSKIEIGQCYSYHDRVFMVIAGPYLEGIQWGVQDTLTKEVIYILTNELLTWRRPFTNCG